MAAPAQPGGKKAQPEAGAGAFGAVSSRCVCGRAGGEPRGREELFLTEMQLLSKTGGSHRAQRSRIKPNQKPPADFICVRQECPDLELPPLSHHPNQPSGAPHPWSSCTGRGRKRMQQGLIRDLQVPGEKLGEFGAPPAPPSGNSGGQREQKLLPWTCGGEQLLQEVQVSGEHQRQPQGKPGASLRPWGGVGCGRGDLAFPSGRGGEAPLQEPLAVPCAFSNAVVGPRDL